MENELFRKKSLKKMQSPDNLNEYIRVINPGLWIVFVAVFLLLAGAFVWGSVGKVEDKTSIVVVSQNGKVVCDYNENFESGMKVVVNNAEGRIDSVSSYGNEIKMDSILADGIYSGYVVTGLISPISFVFN